MIFNISGRKNRHPEMSSQRNNKYAEICQDEKFTADRLVSYLRWEGFALLLTKGKMMKLVHVVSRMLDNEWKIHAQRKFRVASDLF